MINPMKISVGVALALVLCVPTLVSATAASGTAVSTDVVATRFELQVPVLYYHRIVCPSATTTSPSYFECPEQFGAQLSYLHDQGWQTMTVDELADFVAARECPPANRFVISIDDGALDGYTNAAPIMESFGMRGSYFIVSDPEGAARPGQISWDQMRDLLARGHAIGNHTETHSNLKTATPDVQYEEIEGAQQIFDEQLGFRPRTFAYPYGRYNDSAIAQLGASGFELAFTVHAGAKEATDAPFLAKRIEVASDESGASLLAAIEPFADGCRPATPDLAVALASAGPYKGDNTSSTTYLASQTVKRTGVKVGTTYRFWVRLDNDAQRAGTFSVKPTITGTAGMDVRYRVGGVDVTSAIAGGTYVSAQIEPWTSMTIVVRVTPKKAGAIGTFTSVGLMATSTTDSNRVDAARVIAQY